MGESLPLTGESDVTILVQPCASFCLTLICSLSYYLDKEMLSYTLRISLRFLVCWKYWLSVTCPPMCSLPVSAIRSAPPHSSSAWGVEKCADIKTRGFATVQTQWHNRSGRWCDGGVAPRAAVCSRNISSIHPFTDMSASPLAKAATQGQNIPTRRVVITNEEDMPTGLVSDA